MRALVVFVVSLTAAVPLSTAHAQKPKGLVIDFGGRGGSRARALVVSAVGGQLQLERRAKARQIARQLGVRLGSPAGMRRVAQRLGLDVVIRGRVRGRGRRTKVVVVVHDASGEVLVRRGAGPPTGRRGRRRVGRAAAAAVRAALKRLGSGAGASGQADDAWPEEEMGQEVDDEEAEAAWGDEEEEEAELGGEEDVGDDADEDEDDDGDGDGGDEEPRDPGALPWLTVQAGLGLRTRDASISIADAEARRVYDSSPFGELVLRLETRPWLGEDSALGGVYALASAGFSVGLSSSQPDSGESVDTTAYRFLLAAGYVLDLADDDVQLGATIGFLYDAFLLDDNEVMPSARYPAARIGAMLRVHLLEQLLYGQLDLAGRFAFGVGQLAAAFGENASARGFDIGLAAGGALDSGFSYLLRVGYRRFGLDFGGAAEREQADGGSDKSLSANVLAGWSFR